MANGLNDFDPLEHDYAFQPGTLQQALTANGFRDIEISVDPEGKHAYSLRMRSAQPVTPVGVEHLLRELVAAIPDSPWRIQVCCAAISHQEIAAAFRIILERRPPGMCE